MEMTTSLWIMFGGILLGAIGSLICIMTKKKIGVMLSFCVIIACVICFWVDVSLNPIKDPTLVSQSAQQLDFATMINEYRSNEIRAKEIYENNRYEISAKIVSIERAGLREAYSGYNVNMTIDLDDEEFSICANFQGDFKEDIMKLNIGDTLTFTGECVSPSLWYDCTIVKVN